MMSDIDGVIALVNDPNVPACPDLTITQSYLSAHVSPAIMPTEGQVRQWSRPHLYPERGFPILQYKESGKSINNQVQRFIWGTHSMGWDIMVATKGSDDTGNGLDLDQVRGIHSRANDLGIILDWTQFGNEPDRNKNFVSRADNVAWWASKTAEFLREPLNGRKSIGGFSNLPRVIGYLESLPPDVHHNVDAVNGHIYNTGALVYLNHFDLHAQVKRILKKDVPVFLGEANLDFVPIGHKRWDSENQAAAFVLSLYAETVGKRYVVFDFTLNDDGPNPPDRGGYIRNKGRGEDGESYQPYENFRVFSDFLTHCTGEPVDVRMSSIDDFPPYIFSKAFKQDYRTMVLLTHTGPTPGEDHVDVAAAYGHYATGGLLRPSEFPEEVRAIVSSEADYLSTQQDEVHLTWDVVASPMPRVVAHIGGAGISTGRIHLPKHSAILLEVMHR